MFCQSNIYLCEIYYFFLKFLYSYHMQYLFETKFTFTSFRLISLDNKQIIQQLNEKLQEQRNVNMVNNTFIGGWPRLLHCKAAPSKFVNKPGIYLCLPFKIKANTRYGQNEYSYKCTWLRVQFPSSVNQIRDASRVGYVDQNASNGGRFTFRQVPPL